MTSWSDSFETDHWAGGQYTPVSGDDGTDFTYAPGVVTVVDLLSAVYEAVGASEISMALTIENVEDAAAIEMGIITADLASGAVGLAIALGAGAFVVFEVLCLAGTTDDNTASTLDGMPSSGPVTLYLSVTATEISLSADGGTPLTVDIDPTTEASLVALGGCFPFFYVTGAGTRVTNWRWDTVGTVTHGGGGGGGGTGGPVSPLAISVGAPLVGAMPRLRK
jgi:hypothetical protein